MGLGLGLAFVGVSRTRQDQRLGGGEERDNKKAEVHEDARSCAASGGKWQP